jgi:hypothetical protein
MSRGKPKNLKNRGIYREGAESGKRGGKEVF